MAEPFATLQAALAGRYAIERELGHGGMATVYLARDIKHDRPVALKVLRPELSPATITAERFNREIRIIARLSHPHIVKLFDSGEAAGYLYYVMSYVEGGTLRHRLTRQRQLPVTEVVQITREVADALEYAHQHDFVHRDIKPENILLEAGHAVVADFGIARAIIEAGGERWTTKNIRIGTPEYMSPEQAAGDQELDGRSDQYSLGCVVYEMLGGRAPYTGPSAQAILAKCLTAPVPSVRSLRDEVPEGMDAALQRALAKAPADRFAGANEFAQEIAVHSGERAPAARIKLSLSTVYLLVPPLVAVALLGVAYFLMRHVGLPDWVAAGLVALPVASLPITVVASIVKRRAPAGDRAVHRPRRVLIIASLVSLLLLVLGSSIFSHSTTHAMLLTLLRRPDAELIPGRVLVAPLENRTGDTTLDALGPMAADWIGQALSNVAGVEVVDPRTALGTQEVVQRIPWPLRSGRQTLAMAREAGAGLLVSGSVYRQGDSLFFHLRIDDVEHARLVRSLSPIYGSVHAVSHTLAELQRRVTGSVAMALGTTAGTQIGGFAEPPSLAAYQEAYRGLEAHFRMDDSGEYAHLERAVRLDPTYTTPLVFLAFARAENGDYAAADTLAQRGERLNNRLAPAERALLDYVEALIRGDPDQLLQAASRFTTLTPGSQESPLLLASVALATFKPRVALNALAQVNPDRGLNLAGPYYWMYEAEAAAQQGNWAQSLAMADVGRRRFPASPVIYYTAANALARLGQVAELDHIISEAPTRGDVLIAHSRFAVRMWAQLRAAHYRDAADTLITRYARLLDARQTDTDGHARFVRGIVLWRAGRIAESRAIFAALAARDTGHFRLYDVEQLGITSAKLGDRAAALDAERVLSSDHSRYDHGLTELLQAGIAAALGERERAVGLLQQAVALGTGLVWMSRLRDDPDLEPLFGFPPYEELIKPVG